jgi:putative nucleotidyltransferase with HDIG domain
MSKNAIRYIWIVACAAAALIAQLISQGIPPLSGRDYIGLLVFAGLACLAEALATEVSVGPKKQASSSIAFLPIFACLIVYPLVPAICVAVFVSVFTELVFRKPVVWRTAFNAAQYTIAYSLAGLAYGYATGRDGFDANAGIDFAAFWALVAVFFCTNIVLVSTLLSIRQSTSVVKVIRTTVGPAGSNLLYDVLASPIAIVTAVLFSKLYIWGLFLLILPLLLIRYSYASKLQLEKVNKDLLTVLVKAIETRDPYTSGHSLRVSLLARSVAEDIGLSRRKIEQVETAALLHDIGKIDALYTALLSKPYDLTPEERSLIRSHSVKGAELLLGLSAFGQDIVMAVRHHHERYDGSGYPEGLLSGEIPIAARIIMVCDSIDAMLSDRPYRRALSIEQAHSELIKFSGSQFDPEIVRVLISSSTLDRAVQLVGIRHDSVPMFLTAANS